MRKRFSLILISLLMSLSFQIQANPLNFFFSNLTQPRTIITFGSSKKWSDGSYAKTCNDYKNPLKGYAYKGKIGDGAYSINFNGTPMVVYCDMTTDGGGWTLVVAGRGVFSGTNSGTGLLNTSSANAHSCLITGNLNDCPNDNLYWINKNIPAMSYLKKMSSGAYQLVVKMKIKANWDTFVAMKQTDSNFDYTYKPATPSIHYAGYSSDSSGATGCQDAATTYTYLFPISDGNTPCGGSYSLLYNETSGYGFLDTVTGNGAPSQILIR